jgi:hypothetical protein
MADDETGISIEGGVITLEPTTSKSRCWVREVAPRLIWGLLMKDPYISEEIVSPLYIVVWNSDRAVEFYREGPYKGSRQRTALESLRTEINRGGTGRVPVQLRKSTPPERRITCSTYDLSGGQSYAF